MKILLHYQQTMNDKRLLIYLHFILPFFFLVAFTGIAVAGPELIKDINPNGSSDIRSLRAGNERLFFFAQADNNSHSLQLWTSNGVEQDTLQLTDINFNEYTYPVSDTSNLVVDELYFFPLRNQSDRKHELWRSDGTLQGTYKLIDLPDYLDPWYPAAGSGSLYYFVPWNDPEFGRELWVSDGSVSGTRLVKDINPGRGSSSPHNLIAVNDRLYFVVGDNLWVSNGASAGTRQVTYFEGVHGRLHHIINVNGMIYMAYSYTGGHELWRYDSISGQNIKVRDFDHISPGAREFAAVGDHLFFIAKDVGSDAYDLWKTDGTLAGTVVVKNIGETNVGYTDWYLTNVNGTLFFRANDGTHGWELWKSDGTVSGTFMIKDVVDGANSSDLYCFTAVGDTLFFAQKQSIYVTTLWMSDGTEAGTVDTDMGVSSLRCPVNFNEQLYFYGSDRTTDDYASELYRYSFSDSGHGTTITAPEINISTEGVQVTISWNSVANAEGYTLFYAAYPYTGPETIGSIELGNISSFSADLWNGAAFYVTIKAHRSDDVSEYSNIPFFIIGQ
ncbi:MAG: hypothetical protein methR_P0240 [Methyloprofundus sp.]|nr:MAG: hypothetical protein methR_P0240 [Methyloprofundus sp.]